MFISALRLCKCRFLGAAAVTLFLAIGARSQSRTADTIAISEQVPQLPAVKGQQESARDHGAVLSPARPISAVGTESNTGTPAPGDAPAAVDTSRQAPARLFINLPDAQARAAMARKAAELANLNVAAARYHRQAVQSDYFPKIGSSFANLHFNKFMGQEIALRNRDIGIPLVNKDQSLFAVTVTQPVTPLFKVREAIRISRADERIAQAKADAAAAQVAANVEHAYFSLMVAQRQQLEAEIKVKMMARPVKIASVGALPAEPQTTFLEGSKALVTAASQVTELTRSLNILMGLPLETQLELAAPAPMIETISSGPVPQQAIDKNPEVIEARELLDKARAASRLSKLDYVPDVAGLWGYSFQTGIPLLPRDFSFVGFLASWNVFDFGKRERTIKERSTQVRMAEINLELIRAKVATSLSKTSLDLQRTRRILQLTQKVASMYQVAPANYQATSLEDRAAQIQAEVEMLQAELEYRMAYAELKRTMGGVR